MEIQILDFSKLNTNPWPKLTKYKSAWFEPIRHSELEGLAFGETTNGEGKLATSDCIGASYCS